jgi:hypothetical protein
VASVSECGCVCKCLPSISHGLIMRGSREQQQQKKKEERLE